MATPTAIRGRRWPLALRLGRVAVLSMLAILSVALSLRHVILIGDFAAIPFDWLQFQIATDRIGTGTLYEWESRGSFEYSYRYAPLFAYVMVPMVELGITVWRVLQFAVLLLLPWRVALITLIAWPFWEDVYNANVMTLVFVSGWHALNGNRAGTVAYLLLTALVPRPLMLPLVIWILWKQPSTRAVVAIGAVLYAGLTVATGEAGGFVWALSQGGNMIEFERNYGPSRWLGWAWLAVGIPLGAWLIWRGRIGFASLAVSPYLLPYHFIVGLWETARTHDRPAISLIRTGLTTILSRAWPTAARWRIGRQSP